MPFCELHYFSNALAKQTSVNLILPSPDLKPPYQVMFLLHGLSDNHTMWTRRSSIERYVEGLPLIVVMPDTGRGFYVDAAQGPKFGTAIGVELPQIIDTYFKTVDHWSVTGLSMGGYGALKLALTHPERFTSAVSHSGALEFAHVESTDRLDLVDEFTLILGQNFVGGPNDLFALATALNPEQRPALRIDCGVDDFLIESNRSFHRHLTENQIPHEYEEFPGEHTWAYWDEHVQEAIAFHRKVHAF